MDQSLGEDLFYGQLEEARQLKRQGQARIELTRLDRIYGLTGNAEPFREVCLAPLPF